jgi:hypothetical protein
LQAIWKRKVSILKRVGKIDKAVEELSGLLDVFYSDVDGWVELCDLYMSFNQCVSLRGWRWLLISYKVFCGSPGPYSRLDPGSSESILFPTVCRNCVHCR